MQESNSNYSFTWTDLFYGCLAHWKWFVASLVICLSAAAYKIASSNYIYEASASILIKTEDKNANVRQMREAFNMMGFGNTGSNVHNEMLTLQSPTLMAEVVEKLRLNEIYRTSEGIKAIELYKQEPVLVVFAAPNALHKVVKMDITINSNSEFVLKNFRAGQKEDSKKITVKAGNYVETPIGRLLLSPSKHFTNDAIGKTIHYARVDPLIMADSYVARLKVEMPDREASVIDLSTKDASVLKTLDLLTTLIDVYNENWVVNQNAKIKSISEIVDQRIDITIKELNEAEVDISSYISKNLVPDFDQASRAYFSQTLDLNRELMDYRTQVNIAKTMLAALSESEYITLPANSKLTDSGIISQIQEYNHLILERNKLLTNSNPQNSIVAEMAKSLQVMREGVEKSLRGLISNTNMIASTLEQQMNTSQQQLANTPNEARYLANVKREQKIKEELYLFLLKKKEENDLSLSFASDNSQIIVQPHSSHMPVAPNKRLTYLAALIIAFVIPIAILLLRALVDTTIHSKKDLESLTASYLGEIPLAKAKKRRKYLPDWLQAVPWKKEEEAYNVVVKQNSRNIINESFRILRTKLDFMNKSGASKVFVVTSIQPASGKSFISMNLATSYALKGSKVLVIDMDLRRATASKYVASSSYARGIADYLSDTGSDYTDILIKNAIVEGLDVIPVGTIPPNPAELILSERLAALIDTLRNEYDYIFLDCPPIDIVAESAEIARYADMALFVARAGIFPKGMLPEIDELYNKKVFNNMVVILNGVTEGGHYGYGKYGYGKYGYGYGGYGGYGNKHGYYTE